MHSEQQQQVGLITDIHYDGGAKAMNRLFAAVALLNRGAVDVLVVMGDLVNGDSPFHAKRLLREVSALCGAFHGPVYYMPGNHDLDHLSKAEFYESLDRIGEFNLFNFTMGGHRLMSVDGNFMLGGTEYARGNFDWKEAILPDHQLISLREQLRASNEPVVVFSHHRLDESSMFSVQNSAAVREAITESGKVKAVFQGHQHADHLRELDGTAYYTLGAHVDDAGPAVILIEADGIRLIRDYQPEYAH